jgi:acetolactate synthase-1/2/3 large subunit
MEHRCPVKIVLLNNNFLGNVRQWQELFFRHRYSFTHMLSPDYAKVAEAYHIPYSLVTKREDLDEAIHQMLTTQGPYLLEVAVKEQDNVLPMCCPGNDVDDMLLEIK